MNGSLYFILFFSMNYFPLTINATITDVNDQQLSLPAFNLNLLKKQKQK